jgi:hypothetical protein
MTRGETKLDEAVLPCAAWMSASSFAGKYTNRKRDPDMAPELHYCQKCLPLHIHLLLSLAPLLSVLFDRATNWLPPQSRRKENIG